MKYKHISVLFLSSLLLLAPSICGAVTFSGANVPYDSSFHLGIVNGPGTGINIGADVFFPLEGINVGVDIEQQVTNTEFEQNINILKYGVALKYVLTEDFYVTLHLGRAAFYLGKAVDYVDSLSGAEYSIDEDTRGTATYIGFAPNFRAGDYFITPKILINTIADGGRLLEFDLNILHRF